MGSSLARELKSVTACRMKTVEPWKQLKSRVRHCSQVDRTRQDKTDLVKAMVEEETLVTDEAMRFSAILVDSTRVSDSSPMSSNSRIERQKSAQQSSAQIINELRGPDGQRRWGMSSVLVIPWTLMAKARWFPAALIQNKEEWNGQAVTKMENLLPKCGG